MRARCSLVLVLGAAMTSSLAANTDLRNAVTLYASFDKEVQADRGGGVLTLSTRFNHPTEKGKFTFEKGFNAQVFRVAPGKGISGAALEVVDVLPNNGRIFFPAKGNIGFRKGGWSGAVSCWIATNPNELLRTPFCDPVQITHRGSNNGGIWFDWNSKKPLRDLRMGVFPAVPEGQQPIAEDAPDAPLVKVPGLELKAGAWHHVVLNWENLDTGKPNAKATLYIDGKAQGSIADRPLAMDWDLDKAGIYIAVNYIGLLDEFAVFGRPLTMVEIEMLRTNPGVLH